MTVSLWLDEDEAFPSPKDISGYPGYPAGLIAISETMSPKRLIEAYEKGIFPWYSDNQPILWWCISPRMVLQPQELVISQSLQKKIKQVLKNVDWEIKVDHSFKEVIANCAQSPRQGQSGTWITQEIQAHYTALFHLGIAHCVETWYQGQLIGGLYGINLGKMFYGESMFKTQADASKIALAALCAYCIEVGIPMIDCQQETSHLASLGAKPMNKLAFLNAIDSLKLNTRPSWKFSKKVLEHYF